MNDETTLLDLDNIEDVAMGNIEDLPEFVTPPDGVYVFATNTAKSSSSKDKETGELRKRINHTYSICKILQVADPNALVPPLGSLVGENFTFNDMGLKVWKAKIKGVLGNFFTAEMTIKEALAEINDNQYYFVGKTRVKKSTGKNGQDYENVQIQFVRVATDEDLEDALMPDAE